MKKFMIDFQEVITNNHQIIVGVPEHINININIDDVDSYLDDLSNECYTFSDVKMGLRELGFTIIDSLEGEGVGEIEFDYLAETDLDECQ